ncbi:MAG: universal stress protein [Thermodesulfobacterium sp.]|nr:universal stress protein [Thermodesulfobacterium sp.]
MFKPIALAIDFKKFTHSILETGLFLSKNLYPKNDVVLFHAVEYFLTPPHYLVSYFKEEEAQLESKLTELSQIFKKENIPVKNKVIWGNFWEVLKNFTKKLDPSLIVLGYQPHKFKIPTAEKMLERLECNFLAVKDQPLKRIGKILCCIDFSEKSFNCLKMAIFWSERLKSELKVLNVIPKIKVKDKKLKEEILKSENSERKRMWENLVSLLEESEKTINFDFEIVYGDKLKEILERIEIYSSNLLIVGKTGKNIKSGLGSITKELLRKIQIPLLIVENF